MFFSQFSPPLPSTSITAPLLPSHHHRTSTMPTMPPLSTTHQNPTGTKTHVKKKKKNLASQQKTKNPATSDPHRSPPNPVSLHKNVVAHDNETVRHEVKDWERGPRLFLLGNFDGAMIKMGSSSRFSMYDNYFGWGKPLAIWSGGANKFDNKISAFLRREGNGSALISTKPSDPHWAPPNPVTHARRSPPNPSLIWATQKPSHTHLFL